MRRAVAGAALIVLMFVGPAARGDKVDDLMGQLRGDTDYKVRLSAAIALGKLGDKRAIGALADGLGDPDKSVRLVAAGALGKLVDASVGADDRARAVAALETVARGDGEASVRAQAARVLDTLSSLPPPSAGGRGVYIEVGNMADKTQRGAAVIPLMRQSVVTSLQKRAPAYQLRWPSGRSPTEADLRRAGATAFFVDASLTRLDAAGTRVACAVSMILATYPGKSMFGFLNGSAEVDAGSTSQQALAGAFSDCVAAVTEDLVVSKIVPTIQARVP